MHIISLGAGVQSTTMALLAIHGEIEPMPDCAIFADTGWEPKAVYRHLDWLEGRLPFPVHRVTRGNLKEDLRRGGFAAVPFYTPGGMGQRQCTYQYKLRPIRWRIRELLLDRGAKSCQLWIGISTDEAARMKPSQRQYAEHRWPLLGLQMSRWDCLRWLERMGYPEPPKSSCLGCPFHNDADWRRIKADVGEWDETVEMDAVIRQGGRDQYMHRSCKPLAEVDLSTAEDRGQGNLFAGECEGLCGV
jgi:hypothetical protein